MGRNSQELIPLEMQVLNRRAMEMASHGNYLDALKIFSCVVFIAPALQGHSMKWADVLTYSVGTPRLSKDMIKRCGLIRSLFRFDLYRLNKEKVPVTSNTEVL